MNLSTKLSFSIPHKSLMKNTYGKGSIAPVIDPHIHREANSTMDDIVSVLDFSVPTNDFNMIPVGLGGGETDLYTSKEEELVNSESSADNIERYTLKAVDRICLEAMQCISFSPEEGQKKQHSGCGKLKHREEKRKDSMGICSCNKESNSVSNTSFRSQASSGYCGSEFTDSSRCNTTPNSDGSGRFIGSKRYD